MAEQKLDVAQTSGFVRDAKDRELVEQYQKAVDAMAAAGFVVMSHVAKYDERLPATDPVFLTRLAAPVVLNEGNLATQLRTGAMVDHALGDAMRDLLTLWSNARHKAQMEWKAAPKKPEQA